MQKVTNPDDFRYRRSHHQLLYALNWLLFVASPSALRPSQIYQKAHLCKTTFYNHFKSIPHAITTQQHELHQEFKTLLAKFTAKQQNTETISLSAIFTFLNIFILRHYNYFAAALKTHQHHLLHQLLWDLYPFITADWRHFGYAIDRHIYELYIATLTPIFKRNFHGKKRPDHLHLELLHATRIFTQNLTVFYQLATINHQKRALDKPDSVA